MSFRKNLFKNIMVLGGYTYGTQIISFLSSIILSRLLLPSEYGFIALVTVFTGFISQFSDAGLSFIIVRSDYQRLFQSSIHYLAIFIGTCLSVLIILLAYPISLFYKDPALFLPTIIMSSSFILRSFIIVPYGMLAKQLKFNILGLIEMIATIVEILLMIILAYLKFSYWALIIPTIIGNLVRIGIFYYHTRLKLKFMKLKYLVLGFRQSKSIIGNLTGFNILNYWARNSDNLIVGKIFGTQSLGIYDRAYKILNLVLGVMTGLFGKVLYPSLKDHASKGGNINEEYLNTLGVVSLLNFPISVLLICFPEPLVRILWSDAWIQVASLLPYIGILIMTQTLNSTTGNIFILYGKEKALMLLGIPTNILIIGSIAFGAMFSMIDILRVYSIVFVGIVIPCVLYWGFKKAFGFDMKTILKFWVPKLTLSLFIIISIWMDTWYLTIGLLCVYLIHLILAQRKDIYNTFMFVKNKLTQ
jgi:teichuronic acid exporter